MKRTEMERSQEFCAQNFYYILRKWSLKSNIKIDATHDVDVIVAVVLDNADANASMHVIACES